MICVILGHVYSKFSSHKTWKIIRTVSLKPCSLSRLNVTYIISLLELKPLFLFLVLFTETIYSICDIPGRTDCQVATSVCNVRNGSYQCDCKMGYTKTEKMKNEKYCIGERVFPIILIDFLSYYMEGSFLIELPSSERHASIINQCYFEVRSVEIIGFLKIVIVVDFNV